MADFATAYTGSVKMKVPVTTGGNIAQTDDTVTGATKQITIPGIKAAATLVEANTVFDVFIGNIAGGSFDSLSAVKTITQGVAE